MLTLAKPVTNKRASSSGAVLSQGATDQFSSATTQCCACNPLKTLRNPSRQARAALNSTAQIKLCSNLHIQELQKSVVTETNS
jgi:hypothetical protein